MWNVACEIAGQDKPEVVECTNPDIEVNRFRFKNAKANIVVSYNGHVRRVYENGEVVENNLEYPPTLKSVEDFADALAFMSYVGTTMDYMSQVSGTTKKQRTRYLARRLKQAEEHAVETEAA